MPFVKLDCGLLKSTLWFDLEATRVFLTALLDAKPIELREPTPTYDLDSTEPTDFVIPPGWYGLVESSAPGLIHDAMMPLEAGLAALKRLGAPEAQSRTPTFEGRRLVRVSGGFIVLNFQAFRDKDYGAKERARRYRERERARRAGLLVTRERRMDRDERRTERKEKEKEKEKEKNKENHKEKKEGTYVHVIDDGNGNQPEGEDLTDYSLPVVDGENWRVPYDLEEELVVELLGGEEFDKQFKALVKSLTLYPSRRPRRENAESHIRNWMNSVVTKHVREAHAKKKLNEQAARERREAWLAAHPDREAR